MSQKIPKFFSCIICDYVTSNKKDYTKHLHTRKHKIIQNNTKKSPNLFNINNIVNKEYTCVCGKVYKYHSGLYNHKKNCSYKEGLDDKIEEVKIVNKDEMLEEMLKIIKEQQQQIMELIPKVGTTNITNNNNTTNNNNFNLHFFLNEQCKDAININDFVDSLQITIDDLNYTKHNGLIKGITDIMIRGLKELDIHKRPIHCTDTKRETLYIKDENKWEKDEYNEKMKETIITMANKERNAINEWKEAYPLWNEDQDIQDEFILLVNKVYTPIEEQEHYEKKIIKALTKEVSIDK